MILIPRIDDGIVIEAGDFFLLRDEKNLDGFVILDSRPLFELLFEDLEVLNAVILVLVAVVAELVLAVATEEKGRNKRSGREVVAVEEEVVAIKLAVAMYTPLECILSILNIIYQ